MYCLRVRNKGKAKAKASRTRDASVKRRRCDSPAAVLLSNTELAMEEITPFDVAHNLRSRRKVLVPNTDKPGPLKRKKPVYNMSWQIPECVKVALESYNQFNEDDVHVLVKAVDGYVFFHYGEWVHVNFLAKSEQGGHPKASLLN